MRYLITLVVGLSTTLFAQTNLIPFWSGGAWARDNYQWELGNAGRPDNLYSNGVFFSSEPGGGYDLRWASVDCSGVKVGMIDTLDSHYFFGRSIVFGGGGLAWTASVSPKASTEVWRASEVDGLWTLLGIATNNWFPVDGSTSFYRVRAVCNGSHSDWSD